LEVGILPGPLFQATLKGGLNFWNKKEEEGEGGLNFPPFGA